MGRAAVILAAGQGTRMKSALPKVMHQVGGRAMIDWSIDLAEATGCAPVIVVLSPTQAELRAHVEARLGEGSVVIQDPPLGTGHAVRAAQDALAAHDGAVVVLYGDTPLIPAEPVEALLRQAETGGAIGVLGFEAADPGAYGRLITSNGGALERIVEAKEASAEELAVRLCNSGVMAAPRGVMFDLLANVTNDNAKSEYYLTDLVGLGRADGVPAAVVTCDERDVLGVNSRVELAAAEAAFQARRRASALTDGVTLIAPETVHFCHDTMVENDVIIEPHVVFGADVQVASGAHIRAFSHLEGARVGPGCEVGPFARLRPGAVLEAGAKVGNFVEVKKTRMGEGAKANHLAYLGDGDVGAGANLGAGTIFCNYDGFFKYRTVVEAGAFVGSNSALVAPVTVGAEAYVGSGSVITEDVAPGALALGRGRQTEKPGWAIAFRAEMKSKKTGEVKAD